MSVPTATHVVAAHPMDVTWMPGTAFVPFGVTVAEAADIPSVMIVATVPAVAISPALNKDGSFPGGRAGRIAGTVAARRQPGRLPPRN
jgi:hypothetical protein